MANDWTVTVADRIDSTVGLVSGRVATVTSIARWLVYGLVAAIVGTMALVLFAVFAIRILDNYLPQEVWVPDLGLGAIFTVAGLLIWRKRRPEGAAKS
jgi:4-amino-4-deoxy-L-arabinose transferase-like glycosyltransferase